MSKLQSGVGEEKLVVGVRPLQLRVPSHGLQAVGR